MKRFSVAVLAVVTSVLCVGASIWEGAASVSLNGELPDEGYYVATKSFPRNTVVDVINLETGQSIRVIVAAGLDSPGLLAMVSKDAAVAISLNSRSIGRIRMITPSDPVGFSRFAEGPKIGGDPDFDPQAAIAAASPLNQPIQEYPVPSERTAPSVPAPAAPPATAPADRIPRTETRPPVYPAPAQIVPAAPSRQNSAVAADPTNTVNNTASAIQADDDRIVDMPRSNTPDNSAVVEPAPGTFPGYNETLGTYGWTSPPNTDTAKPEQPVQSAPPVPAMESPAVDVSVKPSVQLTVPPPPSPDAQLVLVPAEQRPPEAAVFTGLPPEAEISSLPTRNAPAVKPGEPSLISDGMINPPIEQIPAQAPSPFAAQSSPPSQSSQEQLPAQLSAQGPAPGLTHDPSATPVIPPVRAGQKSPTSIVSPAGPQIASSPVASPSIAPSAPLNGAAVRFSVPLIGQIEQGKYYLQLAAYTQPEKVETEIARIPAAYPLAVQSDNSSNKTIYRLLVGPVNRGESGALLQYFKSKGYQGVFVRAR
ncbi:hypothetical protein AGMMS49991_00780 [Spirochaetia bacterium]|nr:hypothetical protein AGMMS49991_00780 [Spirochaetia bacterium]